MRIQNLNICTFNIFCKLYFKSQTFKYKTQTIEKKLKLQNVDVINKNVLNMYIFC